MMARLTTAIIALTLTVPAAAAQRGYSVTGFDRIQVQGPFVVRVTTGRGSSARAEGDLRAIDEISVQVVGNTLRVRRNLSNNWGGYPGERRNQSATLYLTTHQIEQATVVGTGDLEIDRMEGGRLIVSLGGNGRLSVGDVEADHVALAVTGAGVMEVAGRAETGQVTVEGPGTVSAAALTVDDLRVRVNGPGNVEITAEREADITSVGNGFVTVGGNAACTDRSVGSGRVDCGNFLNRR
ncbi:MAG: head GIN domain-containing protein [Pseudomonadota bacterium]